MVEKRGLRRWLAACLALGLLATGFSQSGCAVAQPVLSPPVPTTDPNHVQITLSNCLGSNFRNVIQMSTDLVHWVSISTNQGSFTSITDLVPNNYETAFFRVAAIYLPASSFPFAIATVNALNVHGNRMVVDSFDSSRTNYSTNGQYSALYRKAGGTVLAAAGITNDLAIGNANIYGHVYTGPGTTAATNVQIGPRGAVGDIAWNASATNIEPGYWMGGFNSSFPDVPAPGYVGKSVPAPNTDGNIVLVAGTYTTATTNAPTMPLKIDGVVNLWVQGSFTLPQIIYTNGGSLILYVGTSNIAGNDVLALSGNGNINSPGYATNLVIFGLQSIKTIAASGNGTIVAVIYAPDAQLTGNGGGSSTLDVIGSSIFNSVRLNGHWNFHFDESLLVNWPGR